ncbi:MAG: hypothetical protein ABR915_16300, partial [Thermoguttaceae bacterium]
MLKLHKAWLGLLILALAATPALAGPLYWDPLGSGGTGSDTLIGNPFTWSSSTWSDGTNPGQAWADTSDAYFGNGGGLASPATINLTGTVTANTLNFGTTTTSGYIITAGSGQGLAITSGINLGAGAQNTVIGGVDGNLGITLAGVNTWTNNSAGGSLTVYSG